VECCYSACRLDEKFIKQILWQTLQGVKYCHENQVGCVSCVPRGLKYFFLMVVCIFLAVHSQRCEAGKYTSL